MQCSDSKYELYLKSLMLPKPIHPLRHVSHLHYRIHFAMEKDLNSCNNFDRIVGYFHMTNSATCTNVHCTK